MSDKLISYQFIRKMLQSGSKSYYDDYIRKKGSSRILHDPPSLLTDRGAYVNFLEVQLERVSAACLGVQSYDQRFNDMQSLIVHVEERVAGTTKLLALTQQCSEVCILIQTMNSNIRGVLIASFSCQQRQQQ